MLRIRVGCANRDATHDMPVPAASAAPESAGITDQVISVDGEYKV